MADFSTSDHLSRLVGARLTGLGRAASLQHFTFGLPDGTELHLHTEVPWRLTGDGGIVVGRADFWRPATAETPESDLESGEIGATLRDVRNAGLRERIASESPIVSRALADTMGGLVIDFSNRLKLELFPDASPATHDDWEFWRLFERGHPHFVVSSDGSASHSEA